MIDITFIYLFKELPISYVDIESRLKALEEKIEKKSSELSGSGNNQIFCR